MSFFSKKKQPQQPLDKLHVVRLNYPIETDCGICGEWHPCLHFDRDLNDLICSHCWGPLRDAEIQLRAFVVKG